MSTAAIVVIGREILTHKFADENGPYLLQRLRALGVDVRRLSVIDDVVEEIAEEVRRCASRVDYVFTTGGVGPTHDDVTFEGIAEAFGVSLTVDPGLRALLEGFTTLDGTNLRMATVPVGAQMLTLGQDAYPIVRMNNVYVLPGVPSLVQKKFEALAPSLRGIPKVVARVFARDREADVAGALATIDSAHPAVDIGSYPRWGEGEHRLIVTLEAVEESALAAACDAVCESVDVVRVERP